MAVRQKASIYLVAVLACATLSAGITDASAATPAGTWTAVPIDGAPNLDQTATLLQDGRVLVAGGEDSIYGSRRADIFDPATTSWSGAAPMHRLRDQATATLLNDGTVLMAGGTSSSTQEQPVAAAEVYDPATNNWKLVGKMQEPRFDAMAVKLKSGQPMICGGVQYVGYSLNSCEIYNPKTQRFAYTGSMLNGRRYSELVRLRDGNVLAVGDGVGPELYSSKTHTWTMAAQSPNDNAAGTVTLMKDGTVVATPSYYDGVEPTDVYHPARDAWTTTGDLEVRMYNATVRLSDGNLMTMGGCARDCSVQNLTDADVYDATTGQWHAVESMNYGREDNSAVALRDGRVLVVGGGNVPEIYTF